MKLTLFHLNLLVNFFSKLPTKPLKSGLSKLYLELSYETHSLPFESSSQLFFETPHKTLKFQENITPLQTNDLQAMLLCSKTMLEIVFQQTGDLNFKKFCFETHYGGSSRR